MKDIIDRYDEATKIPGLLELYFFTLLIVDLILAVWMAFNVPLHLEHYPSLKPLYSVVIPSAFILPVFTAITVKKTKKVFLRISDVYLSVRIVYLTFFFVMDMGLETLKVRETYGDTVTSGIPVIAFIVLFSAFWLVALNRSKKVRTYVSGT